MADLSRSQAFYEKLGLHLTLDWGAFRFLAWDGYHHNLAINLVEGRNAAAVTEKISGLESFSIEHEEMRQDSVDPTAFNCKVWQTCGRRNCKSAAGSKKSQSSSN